MTLGNVNMCVLFHPCPLCLECSDCPAAEASSDTACAGGDHGQDPGAQE